jgi:L-2-hydroxyglutarate oxidase
VDLGDLTDALTFPGLWRFAFRHPRMVVRELAQSLDRQRFIAAARRLLPEAGADDFVPGGASGVRAQAMLPDGRLLDDFLWVEGEGAVHVVNAPSPAATASLAIAQEVARRALARLAEVGPHGAG